MKLPLPIYTSEKISDYGDFDIVVGLDENLVEQLKKYSADENDTELQQNTSDKKRFVEGKYEDWYKKNRTPFALVQKNTKILAALGWFGPEPLHEGCKCHTMAWRSYKPFRGTGIMKGFTKSAMENYKQNIPDVKFWVRVKNENEGSIRLAQYLGLEISKEYSDNESTVLTTYYN